MTASDLAKFTASTNALLAHHSTTAKSTKKAWNKVFHDAMRIYLACPIDDVTPAEIYAAVEKIREMLTDPAQREQLRIRAEIIDRQASNETPDATPRDIVVILPDKSAPPALAQALEEQGLTRHTDPRRTRISCHIWQGRAASSIVGPMVAVEGGQVLPMSTPIASAKMRDASPANEAPAEATDVATRAPTDEIALEEAQRPGRDIRPEPANVEPDDATVRTEQNVEEGPAEPQVASPTTVDQTAEIAGVEDGHPPASAVDARGEGDSRRVSPANADNSPSSGAQPIGGAIMSEYLQQLLDEEGKSGLADRARMATASGSAPIGGP